MHPILPLGNNFVFVEAIQNGEYSSEEWTYYENKLFESALAELDLNSPYLFEKLMVLLPWRTLDEIKNHYEQLIADVLTIEKGQIPTTNYGGKSVNGPDHKRKGVPWTEDEHKLFLVGLDKYGKGDWRSISKYYVQSKTPSQVASHAQKYFRRLKCATPLEKRRYSIHDIRILNSAIVESPARHPNHHALIARIPRDQATEPINNFSSHKNNGSQMINGCNNFVNNVADTYDQCTFECNDLGSYDYVSAPHWLSHASEGPFA